MMEQMGATGQAGQTPPARADVVAGAVAPDGRAGCEDGAGVGGPSDVWQAEGGPPAGPTPAMVAEVCRFLHPEFARGSDWDALREPPRAVLEVYSDQLILKRPRADGALMAAHRVAAADVARVFAAHRGIEQPPPLPYAPNTLLDTLVEGERLVLTYIPAQVRTLTLHQGLTMTCYTLPLPPCVWAARIGAHRTDDRIVALTGWPATFDEMTYHAPLPNVYDAATICPGSVRFPSPLGPGGVATVIDTFFGSHFSANLLAGRSKAHRQNLLEMWAALAWPEGATVDRAAQDGLPEQRQAAVRPPRGRRAGTAGRARPGADAAIVEPGNCSPPSREGRAAAYPLDDLVSRNQTLRGLLEVMAGGAGS